MTVKKENREIESTITNITTVVSRRLASVHNRIYSPHRHHHRGHTVRRHLDILPQRGSHSPLLILRNSNHRHNRNTFRILPHGRHNHSHSPFLILRNSNHRHHRNTFRILPHGSHNLSRNRSHNRSHKGI